MKQITGYVALIDVLGFSNMMSGPDAATSLNRYTDCVTEAASSFDGTAPIDHLLFSDSILLNTSEDSVAALLALLRVCGILVSSLLAMDIPTRGAVSHGSFMKYRSERGVILAGRPILEAYASEKAQKWIGGILCPSVLAQQSDLKGLTALPTVRGPSDVRDVICRMPWPMLLNVYAHIPFKEPALRGPVSFEGYVLQPLRGSRSTIVNDLQAARNQLARLKMLAPGPLAQDRYKETLQWLDPTIENWKMITNTEWWQDWLRQPEEAAC